MAGRPPKPTAKHRLDGTFRADRHADAPQAAGQPQKPLTLKGEASAFWDRVVPGLVASGVATECDTAALVSLCEWWGRCVKITKALDKMAADNPAFGPLMVQADKASKWWSTYAARFGLTPTDRARLKVSKPEKADPFAEFLKNGTTSQN